MLVELLSIRHDTETGVVRFRMRYGRDVVWCQATPEVLKAKAAEHHLGDLALGRVFVRCARELVPLAADQYCNGRDQPVLTLRDLH